jgi:catechol 2,3-dioxygenase-like lactoylglutathione lyase family enzyme
MKMKSIAGITCYVRDLNKTAEFYKAPGFQFKVMEPDHLSAFLNWFWIDFLPVDKEEWPGFGKEANPENKGAGLYLYISVDNVDDSYKSLLSKGLKPSGEPQNTSWGNREFLILDPDGYKLVFFKRK